MGVFSRLNEQQKKQTEAENAMPGAYENRNDEGTAQAGRRAPQTRARPAGHRPVRPALLQKPEQMR